MEADQAIRYARALGARRVDPIHHAGRAHFTEQRDAAVGAVAASEIAGRTIWLRSGETAVIE